MSSNFHYESRGLALILAYSKVISDSKQPEAEMRRKKISLSKHAAALGRVKKEKRRENINIVIPPVLFYLYGNKTPFNARAELIKKGKKKRF